MRHRREFRHVADLHDRGLIDDAEFDRLRAEMLGPDVVMSDRPPYGPFHVPRPMKGLIRRAFAAFRRR